MAGTLGESIGALWVKVSRAGKRFMTGKFTCPHCGAETEIVAFSNNRRSSDRQPNARIFKSTPRDGGGGIQPAAPIDRTTASEGPAADTSAAGEELKDEGYFA